MKIGKKRAPPSSRSSTIGWFVGTSTRTPISDRGITTPPPPFGRCHPTLRTGSRCTAVYVPDVGVRPADQDVAVGGDDVREVAVQVADVEAVPEHVLVGELHPPVADLLRHDAPSRTIEQGACAQTPRSARFELPHEIRKRQ